MNFGRTQIIIAEVNIALLEIAKIPGASIPKDAVNIKQGCVFVCVCVKLYLS